MVMVSSLGSLSFSKGSIKIAKLVIVAAESSTATGAPVGSGDVGLNPTKKPTSTRPVPSLLFFV